MGRAPCATSRLHSGRKFVAELKAIRQVSRGVSLHRDMDRSVFVDTERKGLKRLDASLDPAGPHVKVPGVHGACHDQVLIKALRDRAALVRTDVVYGENVVLLLE